jgi:nucleotide-binding universal stress UspA family protein
LTDEDSQMVVVGRRGRGGLRRALLGSVSSGVAHAAQCPVAVVYRNVSPVQPNAAPIVLGIDGSPACDSAIAIAFDEASRRASDIVAVFGFDQADTPEAAGTVARALTGWRARHPDIAVRGVVACDHFADVLLDESRHAKLVVVGSRGRRRLARERRGSVSAAVMQACRVPVIVVPASHRSAKRAHRRWVH